MHGDGEFNDTEVRPEVSTRFADRSDQKRAHFVSELLHLRLRQVLEVVGTIDLRKQGVRRSLRLRLRCHEHSPRSWLAPASGDVNINRTVAASDAFMNRWQFRGRWMEDRSCPLLIPSLKRTGRVTNED